MPIQALLCWAHTEGDGAAQKNAKGARGSPGGCGLNFETEGEAKGRPVGVGWPSAGFVGATRFVCSGWARRACQVGERGARVALPGLGGRAEDRGHPPPPPEKHAN